MTRAFSISEGDLSMQVGIAGKTSFTVQGEGEWMVLIHGVGLHSKVWQPQIEFFANTFKVLSYDLLGHGQSELNESDVDIDTYVKQLDDLLRHLNIKSAVLVGHSMGGAIAMRYAYRNPSRVGALAVLNAVYCRSDEARQPVLERADILDQGQGQILVEQTLDRWFSHDESMTMPSARSELGKMLQEVNPIGYSKAYRVFAESDKLHKQELANYVSPALFMTGELDPNSTPLMSSQMAKETPQGQALVLSGARHMMPYVNYQQVNEALAKFLMLEQASN